jgi:hypothetical protein
MRDWCKVSCKISINQRAARPTYAVSVFSTLKHTLCPATSGIYPMKTAHHDTFGGISPPMFNESLTRGDERFSETAAPGPPDAASAAAPAAPGPCFDTPSS